MTVGGKRILVGRVGAALGFVCGVIGLVAGLADYTWKLSSLGWFTGGSLLTLLALFAVLDGAIAFRKAQMQR